MGWYLINILAFVLAWYWPTNHVLGADRNQVRARRTCITAAIGWILLSGLRSLSVGADTEAYAIMFEQSAYSPWSDIWQNVVLKYIYRIDVPGKDFGYFLLQKIFRTFTGSYTLWLLFIAIVFTVPMAILIYRYSSNACLSWMLYSTLFYSFFAITGHRQTIATSIVVFGGISLIEKRKLVPFLIVCFLASTIHKSALCFVPFYWISQIKISKPILCLYWAAIIAAFIFRYQFKAIMLSIIGYESYMGEYEGAHAGTFMYLLLLVAFFVTFFSRFFAEQNNPMMQMSVNALMLACIFSPILLMNPSAMRVIQYFSIFLLFLLPEFGRAFKEGPSRQIFFMICSSILILLLIKNQPKYFFFWQ